jgi:hypothetical protein
MSELAAFDWWHSAYLFYSEYGWSVIALDPRSFRLHRSLVQACGGCPYQKMNDREVVLDLTHLSRDIPDASHLYNYFPPAVRSEPEEPTFPDIFDPDCCVSKGSYPQTPSLSRSSGISSDVELSDIDNVSAGNFGREESYVMRSAEGQTAVPIERETSSNQPNASEVAENTNTDHQAQQLHDIASPPSHGALDVLLREPTTTTDILQLVLQEALGNASSESDLEDGLAEFAQMIDDDAEDLEGGDEQEQQQLRDTEAVDDSSDEPLEADRSPPQNWGSAVVNINADIQRETQQQIGAKDIPSAPKPICSNFPILHFSRTDIRLIPNPFAPHPSVVYGGPLRQPFTRTIFSIRDYDRFNMVKYVPEHGLVIAATQKGRAAVISLTEAHRKGHALRINWMVPLASQEKYADRPLIPLLGIAVSPVQGFEMPADVPYIPRGNGVSDRNDLSFHYKFQDSSSSSSTCDRDGDAEHVSNNPEDGRSASSDEPQHTVDDMEMDPRDHPHSMTKLTLPECHAIANRNYQPRERWQGWNPSRRYRLLLMYGDHTVLSYEFWYEWSDAVVSNYDDCGHDDCYDVYAEERDDILLI